MKFISTTVSPTTTFWKAIWQLGCQIRLRIFNIFRQVIGFGQKPRMGDWSSSEPMQWDLSPSGQLGFHDLNQAVEFRQLLLSLARKSAGISISLGAVLLHHFCKGEATVGRTDAQTWDFEKLNFFLPRQVLIKAIPNSYFMSQSGAVQPYPTHPACNCPILWVLMVISTSPI